MERDWNNRSFKEMSHSNGEEDKSPFEIPLVQIARAGSTDPGSNGFRNPFDLPASPVTGQTTDGTGTGNGTRTGGDNGLNGQWRAGYGGVAPSALDATSPNRTQTQPATDGGLNGQWRSPYGGVAPSAIDATRPRDLPQADPNANGGITAPGDPGRWKPSPNQVNGTGIDNTGQPAAVGSDPLAAVGNAGIAAPTDDQKRFIDNSLQTRMNYFTHFVEGGIGGVLGSSIVPYAGDKLFWKPGLDGNRFAEYWRNNHSPLGLQLRTADGTIAELIQRGADLAPDLTAAQATRANAQAEFYGTPTVPGGAAATGFAQLRELQAASKAALVTNPADMAMGKRNQLLEDMMSSRPATPAEFQAMKARIDAAKMTHDTAPITESSFLTSAEVVALKRTVDKYGAMLDAHNGVTAVQGQIADNAAATTAAQTARQAIRDRGGDFNALGTTKPWNDAVRPGAGKIESELSTWRGNEGPLWKGRAFAEGVGVVSAGLAVNYLTDKYMPNMFVVGGKDAQAGDHWRSYLQGPAITAALLMPNKSAMWKVSAAVASTLAIGVGEHFFPEANTGNYSKLMQPNWIDSVGMGAAFTMPFGSLKSRAIAVGGMYALARGADLLNNVAGIHIPGIGDQSYAVGMSDDAAQAIASKKVTSGTFKDIETTNYRLGMENEGALLGNLGKFMNDATMNPQYHLHAGAAMFTALGDVYMDRGTKVDGTALNDKGRILTGTGYDLGGQATSFYRQAMANLTEGQNQAQRNGDAAQQKEMADAQKVVTDKLDKIYGQHDMDDIYKKLQTEYRQNEQLMDHFQVTLKQQVAGLQTKDTAYAAKMCRDIALLDLAIANYSAERDNGGTAGIMYTEALQFLQAAERIQPNSVDVKQLRVIADSLKAKVPQATNNQFNSGFKNPFSVQQ